jgi:hypothetical protein
MTTNPTPRRTGRAGGALLCLIASAPLALTAFIALPAQAEPLAFDAAQQQLLQRSDHLAASRHAVESAQLRRDALQRLGGPVVHLSGAAYAYNANLDVDLNPLNRALPGVLRAWDSQANMVLIRVADAARTFAAMKARQVLVKNVSTMHPQLHNCLRLTVGSAQDNALMLAALEASL